MPADPLDGITTKKGRVVYDRKPTSFTIRDVNRILKNFENIIENKPELKTCENIGFLLNSMINAIKTLLRIGATTFCEQELTLYITDLVAYLRQPAFTEYGGGEFGGGGATREI